MYDNRKTVCYTFPALSMATGSTHKLKIPRGATGAQVLDILLDCTTTFTQVTTPAVVNVGDGTNTSAFADLTVGALASGNTMGASDVVGGIFNAVYLGANYNSGAGLHDLIVTFVAPTGGTPAGVANVTIVVGYDQISV